MKNCLLSIGSFPGRALPTVSSAFSCGAVNPVSEIDIFHLSSRNDVVSAGTFIDGLSRCHDLVSSRQEPLPVFPVLFSFGSCEVDLPSSLEFAPGPDSSRLLEALRGKNLPLSYQKDRDVVEWSFSCLLYDRPNSSCDYFFAYLSGLRNELAASGSVRMAIMFDPADPFSSGVTLALLPWLRSFLSGDLSVALIALAETSLPTDSMFHSALYSCLRDLHDRRLLRTGDSPSGTADAVWLISMPSTLLESDRSHGIAFFAAARALGVFFAPDRPVPSGLHTCEASGAVSLDALGFRASTVASFIEYVCWLLSDLLPSLNDYLSHPSRIRALPNTRYSLFRSLFPLSSDDRLSESLGILEKTLRSLLDECFTFLQSVPSAMRYSEDAQSLWQKASDACGRFITVASEVDVTRTEIRESGLEGVKPVHRDSMEDTDEEHLQRKLEQMGLQMEAETRMRDEALAAVGPFRAVQALRECHLRCCSALEAAEQKMASFPAETTEHLTMAIQERRIRLLRSAVRQSEQDLSWTGGRSPVPDAVSPAAAVPVVLSPAAFTAIRKFLSGKNRDSSLRDLRESLPFLLQDAVLPDAKELIKSLLAEPRSAFSGHSLTDLLRRAWHVCFSAASVLRFSSPGDWPAVPLLPDLLPSARLNDIPDLLRLIPHDESIPVKEEAEKRGLLAMLFLAHYKRHLADEPELISDICPKDAAFARYLFSGRYNSDIRILSLSAGDMCRPFALVVPGCLFRPAARTPVSQSMIPGFVTWYRNETSSFDDPCNSLSEGDRSLLSSRLSDMLENWPGDQDSPLKSFLVSFLSDLNRAAEESRTDQKLSVRIKAVCGLRHLSFYRNILQRIPRFYEHFLGTDPVAAALTGIRNYQSCSCVNIPDEYLYTWRGIPFARENSRCVLESTCAPEEEFALESLDHEIRTLSGISDDYRDVLSREAPLMLEHFPDVTDEVRDLFGRIVEKAEKPLSDQAPELLWPWDPSSPSVRTILAECLGDTLSEAASVPFSDLLTVFPARGGDAIGDSYFGVMCSLLPFGSGNTPSPDMPVVSPDAVLPPLSPLLVSAICGTSEGRLLLTPDFIRLSHPEDHSFRVTITLNGAFTLRLTRVYGEEETLFLYAHDLPTLALWPSVPFRPEHWRAYYVYAHLPEFYSVSVLPAGASVPVPVEKSGSRCAGVFREFPSAFLFSKGEQTIGALPNLLPEPEISPSGNVTACVDFGSACISVILMSGDSRQPLAGPSMVRILLNNPVSTPEFLRCEFMPSVPLTPLFPTVTQMFREDYPAFPVPLVDGNVLFTRSVQDAVNVPAGTLHTFFKRDERMNLTDLLCLHQVMLVTALQARTDGASGLSWRFAVPDEMIPSRRDSLITLISKLAERVNAESGFDTLLAPGPRISFASESAAIGAYFRFCAWEDTRGGFMVMDLGAATVDISLFLRGRQDAVRSCQIPLGVHYTLFPALLRDPLMLRREFGAYPDPAFQADLNSLTDILDAAVADPGVVSRARLAFDHFLSDRYTALINAIFQLGSAGIPSRFNALLLLHLSYVTMLSGLVLLQIAADPNKNDFLPEQMSLCLAGRGALLIEALPDSLKNELWKFLTMFRNKRVASLSLLFSAEKKWEIPVGLSAMHDLSDRLPPSAPVPASLSVRPEELLPEFLLRFFRVFPREAALILPGFLSGDYYHPFTPAGEAAVTEAISRAFGNQENPRPFDSLACWITSLMEQLPGIPRMPS